MNNMTDDDLFRIGTELHDDPTWDGGWMRGGRPVTNLEMRGSRTVLQARRAIVRHEQGCCGQMPLAGGRCPDGGMCERRIAHELAWVFFERLKFLAGVTE